MKLNKTLALLLAISSITTANANFQYTINTNDGGIQLKQLQSKLHEYTVTNISGATKDLTKVYFFAKVKSRSLASMYILNDGRKTIKSFQNGESCQLFVRVQVFTMGGSSPYNVTIEDKGSPTVVADYFSTVEVYG